MWNGVHADPVTQESPPGPALGRVHGDDRDPALGQLEQETTNHFIDQRGLPRPACSGDSDYRDPDLGSLRREGLEKLFVLVPPVFGGRYEPAQRPMVVCRYRVCWKIIEISNWEIGRHQH